jgi:hypothetical protein
VLVEPAYKLQEQQDCRGVAAGGDEYVLQQSKGTLRNRRGSINTTISLLFFLATRVCASVALSEVNCHHWYMAIIAV